jgi:hypothetical protein
VSRRSIERRLSAKRRADDRKGMAILAACALILSGWLYGAYRIDKAHGISVSQSLAMWGI